MSFTCNLCNKAKHQEYFCSVYYLTFVVDESEMSRTKQKLLHVQVQNIDNDRDYDTRNSLGTKSKDVGA